jgi:hypothetical protein
MTSRRRRVRTGFRGRIHIWGPVYINFGKRGYTSTSVHKDWVTGNVDNKTISVNTPGPGSATFYC